MAFVFIAATHGRPTCRYVGCSYSPEIVDASFSRRQSAELELPRLPKPFRLVWTEQQKFLSCCPKLLAPPRCGAERPRGGPILNLNSDELI